MSTAVILAGGKSRRMGTDKLSLRFGDETILTAVFGRFSAAFDHVYISVAASGERASIPVSLQIRDEYENCGPMAGLHAALKHTDGDGAFFVAADMPFADAKAALRIMELGSGHDVAIIRHANGYLEPLFAYYAKSMLPICERCLNGGRFSMLELLQDHDVDIRHITVNELDEYWSDDLLFNINYPADYNGILRRKTGTESNQ
jgi:molybdopterin-guanine dinucleotide biosynthesis protein A